MLGPYNTSDYPITIIFIPLIYIVVPLLPPYCYFCALESKALIPNVMKPAQGKIEKIDQRLRIQPLRGGNLLYIT